MKCQHNKGFPCGQCMACRINQRRIWASRLHLEALSHSEKSFVTWTYEGVGKKGECFDYANSDPEYVFRWSVDKLGFRKYLNQIRTELFRRELGGFRYFAVGEYGDLYGKPHYHAVLFGPVCQQQALIQEIWGRINHGNARFGGAVRFDILSPDLIAYITGYLSKGWVRPHTALGARSREFFLSSRNPGIGITGALSIAAALVDGYGLQTLEASGDIPVAFNVGQSSKPFGGYVRRVARKELFGSTNMPERAKVIQGLNLLEEVGKFMPVVPEGASDDEAYAARVEGEQAYFAKQASRKRVAAAKVKTRYQIEVSKRRF